MFRLACSLPVACVAIVLIVASSSRADLEISSTGTPEVVTFETPTDNVTDGPYLGTGLDDTPEAPQEGELDTQGWAINNGNATSPFGGPDIGPGVFGRGYSNGVSPSTATSGVYSLDTDNNGTLGDSHALGVRPNTAMSIFNPGDIKLRVFNNTGNTQTDWFVAYDVDILNDEDRPNTIDFAYSTDDITYTTLSALQVLTPTTADASPAWTTTTQSAFINVSVADGSRLYLRWTIAFPGGGSGSDYDLIAFDNITVGAAVPEASQILAFAMVGLVSAGGVYLRKRRAKKAA